MALHIIELPAAFYDDHCGRMSDKNPEEPAYSDRLIKRKGRLVVVEACDEALEEIESDADYYASQRAGIDMDREYFGIIRSAAATLARIKAYRVALASKL